MRLPLVRRRSFQSGGVAKGLKTKHVGRPAAYNRVTSVRTAGTRTGSDTMYVYVTDAARPYRKVKAGASSVETTATRFQLNLLGLASTVKGDRA